MDSRTDLHAQVAAALAEDVGSGDVTAALVPAKAQARAHVVAREEAVLCGSRWFEETFVQLDRAVRVSWTVREGERIARDARVCTLEGPARALLTGERTALNFLQTLSGTATAARRFADAVAGTACRILDTRKTIPGLRAAQKYAVRCGGAFNHRLGLYDMVLVKENHIAAAGSIRGAIENARRTAPGVRIEVEVENLAELREALVARPDIVMLDDFSLEDMRAAVAENVAAGRPVALEASGSVSLERVRTVAETGVDFVSVGAITKHLRAIDFSMRFELTPAAQADPPPGPT